MAIVVRSRSFTGVETKVVLYCPFGSKNTWSKKKLMIPFPFLTLYFYFQFTQFLKKRTWYCNLLTSILWSISWTDRIRIRIRPDPTGSKTAWYFFCHKNVFILGDIHRSCGLYPRARPICQWNFHTTRCVQCTVQKKEQSELLIVNIISALNCIQLHSYKLDLLRI